jgi:arabinose-5-phosphate isomerase
MVVIIKGSIVKGILTDGDARRGIKFYSKNDKLEKFITKNPLFISDTAPASKALAIINERKITSLLVTSEKEIKNKNKRLRGIVHIHSLLQYGIK